MPRRLTIAIRPDGSIVAEASGTPGPDCLDAIEQLKVMLNAEVDASKPTPEFTMSANPVRIETPDVQMLEDRA